MAALYIKDPETAALAERVSRRLGTTKTDAVRRALTALDENLPKQRSVSSLMTALDTYRATHPLPPPTGNVADKAFFDRLWGEPD